MPSLAFIGNIGLPEILVLGVLGLLIFGRRLPEVGRNLGKGIVEFKKGLAGVEDNVNQQAGKQVENTSAPKALGADEQMHAIREELRLANEKLRALEQKSSPKA